MEKSVKIGELVKPAEPCSILYRDLTYSKILDILDKSMSGIVLVMSDKGGLYGIITMGDIRNSLNKNSGNIEKVPVEINTSPLCAEYSEEASSVLHMMRNNDVTIMPVLSGTKLLGYVTLQDIAAVFSPERIYITDKEDYDDINHIKHSYRYKFATMFIDGGNTLDCACGSGYGSKILSKKSGTVLGVDISKDGIDFAEKNNSSENITYRCQSIQSLDFSENSFDSIVSLETLEHITTKDMVEYLGKASKWIKPGGCFIGSSPMLRYKDGKPFITNPYHVNELPKNELMSIILSNFRDFKTYFFHQEIKSFLPLNEENTGFCIIISRKPE